MSEEDRYHILAVILVILTGVICAVFLLEAVLT
jgi:hypothetical protein